MAGDLENRHVAWIAAWGAVALTAAALLTWSLTAASQPGFPKWPIYGFIVLLVVALYLCFTPFLHTWPFGRVSGTGQLSSDELQNEYETALNAEREAHNAEKAAHSVTKAMLQAELENPVSPEHRERLKGIARAAANSVTTERGPCKYSSDLPGSYEHREGKSVLAAHFPEASATLDRWDAALTEQTASHVALIERINADVHELMNSEPWQPETICLALQAHIEKCAQARKSGEREPEFKLVVKDDGTGIWPRVACDSDGKLLGWFESELFSNKGAESAAYYHARFNDWSGKIGTSLEFDVLRVAWLSTADARQAALEAMRQIERKDKIYGRCSECAPPK